jgi:anti-anti-sigma regulatory factor
VWSRVPGTRHCRKIINGVPVVAAPAEIDMATEDQLRAPLLDAISRGHPIVVVDMTRTPFCDSSGIHAFISRHGEAVMALRSRTYEITFVGRGTRTRFRRCWTTRSARSARSRAAAKAVLRAPTSEQLYAEARRRSIKGRSSMNKAPPARALGR